MARLILLGVTIAGVVWLARRLIRARSETPTADNTFTPTVRCNECGAYIATRHAITHGDGHRCRIHDDDKMRS